MASHRDQGGSHPWQGGSEPGVMDASFYLDDLLRNMQGSITEVEPAGAPRGSQLQTPVSPLSLQGFGPPVQTIPIRRPSPFSLGSLPASHARGVSAPVPQRLVVQQQQQRRQQQEAYSSGSGEEDDWDMSSGAPSEATNSQSLITHRSARSDPGTRSTKRGRSAVARGDHPRGRQGSLAPQMQQQQERRRSSPRVSWKDGRGAIAAQQHQQGGRHGGGHPDESEEEEEEEKKSKKGGGGGNREAVRKYRAKKKAQAREMELQLDQLRRENAGLQRRVVQHADLAREVVSLRSLVLQLYQRLGETPPSHLQQAAAEAGHTADSDKPMGATEGKLALRGTGGRPPSPSLLPTGNSSTLANVVLAERPRSEVPTLAQAALPDFPGTNDWLAAMSAMDTNANSTLTAALPHQQNTMGFSYQNAALLPTRTPLHSTIQEGLAFSAPSEHQDFGARFDSSD